MKKIIVSVLFLMSTTTWAQSSSTSTASPVSNSTATNGVGNAQNITFSNPADSRATTNYTGDYTIRNVPAMGTTLLTTSNDTCMGSTSGSVVMAGFGIGGGSTYVDNDCKRLKNSRELWNMGMKAASLALMCDDDNNRRALEVTGYACPTKPKE